MQEGAKHHRSLPVVATVEPVGAAHFQGEFSDLLQACRNPGVLRDVALNDKSKTPISIKIHLG